MPKTTQGAAGQGDPRIHQLGVKAISFIDELNYWETGYGRTRRERSATYKIPGEAAVRIGHLKSELIRLSIVVEWNGAIYQIDPSQFETTNDTVKTINKNGPPVMSAEERQGIDDDLVSFKIARGTNRYKDTKAKSGGDGESHKRIKFQFKVTAGSDETRFALVNWKKGFAMAGDGTFFTSTVEGNEVDINYSNWEVDTLDSDPVFLSLAGDRWRYESEGQNTYSAKDDPCQALSSEPGAEYAMKFKMCIYRIDDLPLQVTNHVIQTKAIKCLDWEYSTKVSQSGSFSHPKI